MTATSLRHVFEAVVRAPAHGRWPDRGEGFAVDASVIEADASRYHGKAPDEVDWSAPEHQTRAVAEFLSAFDDDDNCRRRSQAAEGDLADRSLFGVDGESQQTGAIWLWPPIIWSTPGMR